MSNEFIAILILIGVGGPIVGSAVWAIFKVRRDCENGPSGVDW